MDSSSFKNAKQIAGTTGSSVSNGRSKDYNSDLYNFEKPVKDVPKEMIHTRLKMGLTPKK